MLTQLIAKRPQIFYNFPGAGFIQKQRLVTFNRKNMGSEQKPVESAIKSVLEQLSPVYLEVVNESHMHNVPKGSETHFKVLIVTPKFEGIPLIKRHRMINGLIKEQLKDDFPHALSLETKTPNQWRPDYKMEPSPNCRGGFGK